MPNRDLQQNILSILQKLPSSQSTEPLKELFWENLNYDRTDVTFSKAEWSDKARNALEGNPILFATAGVSEDFQVIYCKLASDRLLLGLERPVINTLLNNDHPYSLFIFSTENQDQWHFVNVKYDEKTDKRRLFRSVRAD